MDTVALPSFSLILETENLANADLEGLSHSLKSLVEQTVSLKDASEVILVDSGDAPVDLLNQLCQRYPWIKICPAPAGTGYYQAKMLGAHWATGTVVVYCDSDCIYPPDWLHTLLSTFLQGQHIQVVAGETAVQGSGAYGLAMALTYIFPQYSNEQQLAPSSQYFLNNVAFRRQFLLEHPIPGELPLYRGNCVIHARELLSKGYTIWRQPLARAIHAPPNGLPHFFWRFLLIGHDLYWQTRSLTLAFDPAEMPRSPEGTAQDGTSGWRSKIQVFFERVQRIFQNNATLWVYLPWAIPIVIVSIGLIFAGYLITSCQPKLLLETYHRVWGE